MSCHIIKTTSAFNISENSERFTVESGGTIWQWLELQTPNFNGFDLPTICILNGEPILQAQWKTYALKDGDVVCFVPIMGDAVSIIVAVVVAILAVVVISSLIPDPAAPNSNEEGDPVYSLKAQNNQAKLLQPIERPYGRNRIFPSYAARPFNTFSGNDQFLYQLFCIGHGEYDIEDILIQDTPLSGFEEVTYQIVEPFTSPTLFPQNVITSPEVGSIELFGSNQPEYGGWSGGFVANDSANDTDKLEVDINYPQGLYTTNEKGRLGSKSIALSFEYRKIDAAGDPLGAWATLVTSSRTLATITPQRFTLSADVQLGRYEVRARRTNTASTSNKGADTAQWSGLRAFIPSHSNFGNVTVLALKARATNSLNNQSSHKVNVIATAKIPVWNGAEWVTQATRSPAWAFCDIFRASYGGKMVDSLLDLDYLLELDARWIAEDRYFDWVFSKKVTVWEAAKTVARIGRGIPILKGSLISMSIDEIKTIPAAVFSPHNMIRDSFTWAVDFHRDDRYDCVEIEYLDPVTWKPETMICAASGSPAYNPKHVKFDGCTDRDKAYQEGMYMAQSMWKLGDNVVFSTGLEGYLPVYGDLISVSHDMPEWGQSSTIEAKDGTELTLGDDVEWEDGFNHYAVIRLTDGTGTAPILVTKGATDNVLLLDTDITDLLYFDDAHERPLLQFGRAEVYSRLMKVVDLRPRAKDEVQVKCIAYDETIFDFDDTLAPILESSAPDSGQAPTINGLTVSVPLAFRDYGSSSGDTPMCTVQISWQVWADVDYYIVEQSADGVFWTEIQQTNSTVITLSAPVGDANYRVAGVNVQRGAWATWSGTVGYDAQELTGAAGLKLVTPFIGDYASIEWDFVLEADEYEIQVTINGVLNRSEIVAAPNYIYNYSDAVTDGEVGRDIDFAVRAINSGETGELSNTFTASNPIPSQLTGIMHAPETISDSQAVFRVTWGLPVDTDIAEYKVWASTTAGFTPNASNLIVTVSDTQSLVPITKNITDTANATTGTFNRESGFNDLVKNGVNDQVTAITYYRVSAIDVWGDDVNLSDQQVIATV